MIRAYRQPRYVSDARAAVGPARLRAFTRRIVRKGGRRCVVCGGARQVQGAHLVAVSAARGLALREKNAVPLCRADHLAFDCATGVIPPGSRLYVDPQPRYARYVAAFGALAARRALLEIAYATTFR